MSKLVCYSLYKRRIGLLLCIFAALIDVVLIETKSNMSPIAQGDGHNVHSNIDINLGKHSIAERSVS